MSGRFWFYFIVSTVVLITSYFVFIYPVGMTTMWWISNIWFDILLVVLPPVVALRFTTGYGISSFQDLQNVPQVS